MNHMKSGHGWVVRLLPKDMVVIKRTLPDPGN